MAKKQSFNYNKTEQQKQIFRKSRKELDDEKHQIDRSQMSFKLSYPYNDKFDYTTELKRIDMDDRRKKKLRSGKGFVISEPKGIKKDIKTSGGIFSYLYSANSMADADSFNGKYRCQCGRRRGSVYHGDVCPWCNTVVRYVDDDISKVGYLILKDPYYIIHPNLYQTIAGFIGGARLLRIIEPEIEVDTNGNIIPPDNSKLKKEEQFKGIGILEFRRRFDEIMNFFLNRYPHKKIYYDDIMANKDIVFTHTISVFSSILRPSKLDNGSLKYETCNEHFNILANMVYRCNDDALSINQNIKEKYELLSEMQKELNNVYIELKNILSKKKGDIRSALGGRCIFTERSVIRQDISLRANQVRLPFHGLCELLQQVIINILQKSFQCTYSEAWKRWYKAQLTGNDKIVWEIIEGLIRDSKSGLPIFINRNPTIQFGGVLACRCIGINNDYTMSISLLVLKKLGADFDGDTLNIWYLYNKDIIALSEEIISPSQMFISHADGKCDMDLIFNRDVIINANSLKHLYKYTPEQIEQIRKLQQSED